MDVLSEVLHAVKLDGATFLNAEFSSPWGFLSPPMDVIAPHLGRPSRHIIIYHLLLEGKAVAELLDGNRLELGPGDVVVFPHGDSHVFRNGMPTELVKSKTYLTDLLGSYEVKKMLSIEGGGLVSRFVCGYMSCEKELSAMVLSGLPPLFKVNIRNDAAGQWLENSIRFSANGTGQSPGGPVVLAKLSEALFVETLRRYMAESPQNQTGWLAGARDPHVGAALGLLHSRPAHSWTIAELAEEVGVSRSVLAERFRVYLGEGPISYLSRWRLRLGAQLLQSSSRSVVQIASEVGYESEAAFNRAFKREYGEPPARFRTSTKAAKSAAG